MDTPICEHVDRVWNERCSKEAAFMVARPSAFALDGPDESHHYCRDHIGHHLGDYSGSTDYSYTVWRPA